MDTPPNCAICNAPAYPECPCESERLHMAVQQSEKRVMEAKLKPIRHWVIEHAREHVIQAFTAMTTRRKAAHSARLHTLPYYHVYMQYSGHPPIPGPAIMHLQASISDAHAELKRGIDADWRAAVQQYPDVLDYFFSLVELRTPSDRSPRITEPPVSSFGGGGHAVSAGGFGAGFGVGFEPQRRKKRNSRDRDTPGPPDKTQHRRSMSYQVPVIAKPTPPVAPMPPMAPSYKRRSGYYGY